MAEAAVESEEEARQPVAAQGIQGFAAARQPPPLLGAAICAGHSAHCTVPPAGSWHQASGGATRNSVTCL